MRAGFKPYAIDTGLRNRVAFAFSEDIGWLVENVIYCHLKRQHEEVYYYSNDSETDFIIKEGMNIVKRVQVWYEDVSVTAIPEREIAGFTNSIEGLRNTKNFLITNDYEDIIDIGADKIHCIPVIKYLMQG